MGGRKGGRGTIIQTKQEYPRISHSDIGHMHDRAGSCELVIKGTVRQDELPLPNTYLKETIWRDRLQFLMCIIKGTYGL